MQSQNQNHTYSLRAILDSDRIDPDLCRLMLHEIKSPLLEHSFQMTTDDDRTQKNGGSMILNHDNMIPNRPEHDHLDSYTVTNSYYETSRKPENADYKRVKYERENEQFHNKQLMEKFAESIVSPLDHEKFLQDDMKSDDFHIFFQNEQAQVKPLPRIGQWCGGIFNPNLQYSNQVLIDSNQFQYIRRKIFKNKQKLLQQPIFTPKLLNFKQCVDRLAKIKEPQLGNFVLFVSKCLPLLGKLNSYYENLHRNSDILNEILLENNPVNYETRQSYQNVYRIQNRLKSHKTSEMFEKLTKKVTSKSTNEQRNYIQSDIEVIFSNLNEVEDIVQNYVSRNEAVQELTAIHGLLYSQKSYKNQNLNQPPASPIENLKTNKEKKRSNLSKQSLKIRLLRLFNSLKIDEVYFQKLEQLNYLWPNFDQPHKYCNTDQFIRELCRNDILVPIQPQKDHKIMKKLEMEGFRRNQ